MVIIYAGRLMMYTVVDDNTEFPVAYMEKGSVINAHNSLIGAPSEVSVRCLTSVSYYYLSYKQLMKLSM